MSDCKPDSELDKWKQKVHDLRWRLSDALKASETYLVLLGEKRDIILEQDEVLQAVRNFVAEVEPCGRCAALLATVVDASTGRKWVEPIMLEAEDKEKPE